MDDTTRTREEHLTDDDLVLLHYGEPGEAAGVDAEAHVSHCEECRKRLEDLRKVLHAVRLPVPEPDRFFEARVWQAVAPRLEPRAAGTDRAASPDGGRRPAPGASSAGLLRPRTL